MRTVLPALALALGALGASPVAAQNLVQNGDFEAPSITGTLTLTGCPAGFAWCIGQGNIDLVESAWVPAEGRQSLDLNGDAPGSIFQDLLTVPGLRYDLSFRLSGNPDGGPLELMNIFWGSMDLGTFAWVVFPGQSPTNMFWSLVTVRDLPATSASTRLEFRSMTTTPCGPAGASACGNALDAVRVVAVADVPEPTTLALLGAGVAGLLGVRRRRSRR